MKKLSPTMASAIVEAQEHGGELIRLAGGFWTYPDCPRRTHDGVPEWYIGASTIQALAARGCLRYSEWKQGRGFSFPVRANLVQAEPQP